MVSKMLKKINLFIAFLVVYFSVSANAYYFSNSQGSEDETDVTQEENAPVGTPAPSVDIISNLNQLRIMFLTLKMLSRIV